MPMFEKGCFCCELETCVKIQGFLCTGLFVALAILDSIALVFWIIPKELNPPPHADDYDRRFISNAKIICVLLLACLVLWVLLGALLLLGIYKKKRRLLWPYMFAGGLNAFVTTGLLIFYASSVHSQVGNMMAVLVFLILQFYLLIHVICLYQKMGDEERRREADDQHY